MPQCLRGRNILLDSGIVHLDVVNIVPTQWFSLIKGSHNISEFGAVFVDCIINCGPCRGCNAACSIGRSPDVYVARVLTLSRGL